MDRWEVWQSPAVRWRNNASCHVESGKAEFVMAIDLVDAVSPSKLREDLKGSKVLAEKKIRVDTLSTVLASIQGAANPGGVGDHSGRGPVDDPISVALEDCQQSRYLVCGGLLIRPRHEAGETARVLHEPLQRLGIVE